MISFKQFAAHLERSIAHAEPMLTIGLAKVGELTQTMAVEYIGHEMMQWAPLSDATMHGFHHPYGFYIPGKVELGYTGHVSETDPLLRTGAMRDSIHFAIEGLTLIVGSTSQIAKFQELGTVNHLTGNIPPRPFIATASLASLEHYREVFGEIAVKLLTPGILK